MTSFPHNNNPTRNDNDNIVVHDDEPFLTAASSTPSSCRRPLHDDHDHDDDPFRFPIISPTRRFPRPPLPPYDAHVWKEAEELVTWAIASKHEYSPANLNRDDLKRNPSHDDHITNANNNNSDANNSNDHTGSDPTTPYHHAARQAARLHSLLSSKHPAPLLHCALHVLCTSHHGRELDRLASHPRLHARAIHQLWKLDPFSCGGDAARGLAELEAARRKRAGEKGGGPLSSSGSGSPPRVHIAEEAIRRKERGKFVDPALPFYRYSVANAHLHLVLQMVSSNAILAKSAVRSLWGWLTDFGGRWVALERDRRRREKQRRRRWERNEREKKEREGSVSRENKRRRLDEGGMGKPEEEKESMETDESRNCHDDEQFENGHAQQPEEPDDDPEELRPVPGMNGLSVQFVRENFFAPLYTAGKDPSSKKDDNGNENETDERAEEEERDERKERMELEKSLREGLWEEGDIESERNVVREVIAWDRLPSGRVHRLLLTLINIFRLCPRSKTDLLDEISNHFPHYKTCPAALYTWYIHLCRHLVTLVPTMEAPIMTLFLDKALDMDVEIKINHRGGVCLDIDGDEEKEEETKNEGENEEPCGAAGVHHGPNPNDDGGGQFQMVKKELFERDDHDHGTSVGDGPPSHHPDHSTRKRSFRQMASPIHRDVATPTVAVRTPPTDGTAVESTEDDEEAEQISEIAERLDSVMTLLCKRIVKLTSYDPTSLKEAMVAVLNARRLYRQLDGVFDKKVRTTDRSKFVQFVFFVLFGRENDALETVGKLMARREEEQLRRLPQPQQPPQHPQPQPQPQPHAESGTNGDIVTLTDVKLDPDLVPSASTPLNFTDPMYRGFSAKLIDLFYNPTFAGDAPRQTVLCYLASFVSRATYVCPETVCECLAALLRWAELYVEAHATSNAANATTLRRLSSTGTSARSSCDVHALFYTACQAAFYIMCFRGVEAVKHYRLALRHKDDPDSPYADIESIDISPKRWRFLCGHALQPVKHCLESVRIEFLHLAEDLELFRDDHREGADAKRDEETFLEHLWNASTKQSRNTPHGPKNRGSTSTPARKRVTIIATSALQEKKRLDGGVGGLGRGSNPLDSFFPFDPYLLEKSYEFVHPYYRNWEDCILSMEEDGDGDGDTETPCKSNMGVIGGTDGVDDEMVEESKVIENEEEDDDEEDEDEDGGDDFGDNGPDDDEVGYDDFDDEEDVDDDDDGDGKKDRGGEGVKDVPKLLISTHEDIEMEIRRSRAMSTGSQCSW